MIVIMQIMKEIDSLIVSIILLHMENTWFRRSEGSICQERMYHFFIVEKEATNRATL